MNPVDMVVTPDHKLLGVAFNKSQVSAYSVNLLDVAPFDEAVAVSSFATPPRVLRGAFCIA